MRRLLPILWLSAACSAPPLAPGATPPVVLPSGLTVPVTGTITATNGGQPIEGVNVTLGTSTATTDGNGRYEVSLRSGATGSLTFTVSGPTVVARQLEVLPFAASIAVDAIRVGGGFDLAFYRELVRNGRETTNLLKLARWTTAPAFIVRTVDEAGRSVDPALVSLAVTTIRDSVGPWSGGRFSTTVQTGTDATPTTGIVIVRWLGVNEPSICGRAVIAGETMWLNPLNSGCSCGGSKIDAATIRHEVGHIMGFWHTDRSTDAMWPNLVCGTAISQRERDHAKIAYLRPVGNADPDTDPTGPVAKATRVVIP